MDTLVVPNLPINEPGFTVSKTRNINKTMMFTGKASIETLSTENSIWKILCIYLQTCHLQKTPLESSPELA